MKLIFIVLALAAAGAANAGCPNSKAPIRYEFRSTPPLLAAQGDTALVVAVHSDGCVSAHYPKHDIRRGDYALQLEAREFEGLANQIRGAGIAQYDAQATTERLTKTASRGGPIVEYRITDENILEFRIPDSAKQGSLRSLRVTSLRNDLLALPDDAPLLGLAAADELFLDIGERARAHGAKVQP